MTTNSTRSYKVKDIWFNGERRRILLQSANGPCALLAIANALILLNRVSVAEGLEFLSFDQLIGTIANLMVDSVDDRLDDADVSEAVDLLPVLDEGMHVNLKFVNATVFEKSPEMSIFSLLGIPLYHTWVVSEEDSTAYPYLANLSFDGAQTILASAESLTKSHTPHTREDRDTIESSKAISAWMSEHKTQTTYDGMVQLNASMEEENCVSVLFRNNHFNTLVKHAGVIYSLATDVGFSDHQEIVFEKLDQIDGSTNYVDGYFNVPQHSESHPTNNSPISPPQQPMQSTLLAQPSPQLKKKDKGCTIC